MGENRVLRLTGITCLLVCFMMSVLNAGFAYSAEISASSLPDICCNMVGGVSVNGGSYSSEVNVGQTDTVDIKAAVSSSVTVTGDIYVVVYWDVSYFFKIGDPDRWWVWDGASLIPYRDDVSLSGYNIDIYTGPLTGLTGDLLVYVAYWEQGQGAPAISAPLIIHMADAGKTYDFTTIDNNEEALAAIVQAASVQEKTYALLLDIFSDNFTKKLFDSTVEASDQDYDRLLVDAPAEVMSAHEAYLKALNFLDVIESESSSNPKGSSTNVGAFGLPDSAMGFFYRISGIGKRSRERILNLSKALPAHTLQATKQEMYEVARGKYPDKVGNSPDEMFSKLEKGELDTQATQLHSYFTGVEDYGTVASWEKERTLDVSHKEGADGVSKGADGCRFYNSRNRCEISWL